MASQLSPHYGLPHLQEQQMRAHQMMKNDPLEQQPIKEQQGIKLLVKTKKKSILVFKPK